MDYVVHRGSTHKESHHGASVSAPVERAERIEVAPVYELSHIGPLASPVCHRSSIGASRLRWSARPFNLPPRVLSGYRVVVDMLTSESCPRAPRIALNGQWPRAWPRVLCQD